MLKFNLTKINFHDSSYSSGCRVVQSLIENLSSEQCRLLTQQLEDPSTLLYLVSDQCGTFVAQTCLTRLSKQPAALLVIVTSLQGKVGELGCTQHGTFFLQKLVEVLGGKTGPAYLLHEDILLNISTLVMSEVSLFIFSTLIITCVYPGWDEVGAGSPEVWLGGLHGEGGQVAGA